MAGWVNTAGNGSKNSGNTFNLRNTETGVTTMVLIQ
jgi:hypothetical protein